jgi:7-cyano-7-deazaguanine reductase
MNETTLTQLGREVRGFASPDEAVLERVPNPQAGTLYLARCAP